MASQPSFEEIAEAYRGVQDHIVDFLQREAHCVVVEDLWTYDKGTGGGRTRVTECEHIDAIDLDATTLDASRSLIEKGGVNFSAIGGDSLPSSSSAVLMVEPAPFQATGVSLVIHPRSPHIPTIHMNIRFFESGAKWWFGGGVDLTPNYVHEHADVVGFHATCRAVCERHGVNYLELKRTCDSYFYLAHRDETRGIGGLFYDHLNLEHSGHSREQLLRFSVDLGRSFVDLYAPFITKYRAMPYSAAQREYLLHRRSRYVEFNLLFDRGTKFGIQSQGRTESILMSMPAVAKWSYNWAPEVGTPEHDFTTKYLHASDWLGLESTQ